MKHPNKDLPRYLDDSVSPDLKRIADDRETFIDLDEVYLAMGALSSYLMLDMHRDIGKHIQKDNTGHYKRKDMRIALQRILYTKLDDLIDFDREKFYDDNCGM